MRPETERTLELVLRFIFWTGLLTAAFWWYYH